MVKFPESQSKVHAIIRTTRHQVTCLGILKLTDSVFEHLSESEACDLFTMAHALSQNTYEHTYMCPQTYRNRTKKKLIEIVSFLLETVFLIPFYFQSCPYFKDWF